MIYDHNTHQSRCFGFVEFEADEALRSVLEVTKHIIDGATVECKPVYLKSELEELGPVEGQKKKFSKCKRSSNKNSQSCSTQMTDHSRKTSQESIKIRHSQNMSPECNEDMRVNGSDHNRFFSIEDNCNPASFSTNPERVYSKSVRNVENVYPNYVN